MRLHFHFLILLLLPFIAVGQTAFSAAMSLSLEKREYEFTRPINHPNPGISHRVKWNTSRFPALDFSLVKFRPSGNFNRFSMRGLVYRTDDNLTQIEDKSTGLEEPASGTLNTSYGAGFRYMHGWKVKCSEGSWALFLAPFAGLRYDYSGSEPKSSASFPVLIHSARLEAGLGGFAFYSFSKTGFLMFGLPLSFYETGFETTHYLNPVLSASQQRQTSFHHDFQFWKRSGVEIGVGFYLK